MSDPVNGPGIVIVTLRVLAAFSWTTPKVRERVESGGQQSVSGVAETQ